MLSIAVGEIDTAFGLCVLVAKGRMPPPPPLPSRQSLSTVSVCMSTCALTRLSRASSLLALLARASLAQVELPMSQAQIGELSEGVRADQKKLMEAAPTEWNSGLAKAGGVARRGGEGAGEVGGERGADEDSSLGLLHRLLLAEMHGDGPSGGLNNRWIDRDALLQVMGRCL